MQLTFTKIGQNHAENRRFVRCDLTHDGLSHSCLLIADQNTDPTLDQVLQAVYQKADLVHVDYPDQDDLAHFLVDKGYNADVESLRTGIEIFRQCHEALRFLRETGVAPRFGL